MTLHATSIIIHKTIRWMIIVGISIVTIFIIIRIIGVIIKVLNPPPPNLPQASFGKLPPIAFPVSPVNDQFTYVLDTLSGELPNFTDRVNVYNITRLPITLLSVKNAEDKVSQVGFLKLTDNQFRQVQLSTTKYMWQSVSDNLLRKITMDMDTYNFTLTTTYKTFPQALSATPGSSQDNAKSLAINYLTSLSLLPEDIDRDKTIAHPLMMKSGSLIDADIDQSTELYRVDLFQKDIDKLPIFNQYYPFSTMYFLVRARAGNNDDVLEAKFPYQKPGTDNSTYPIKTIDQAYAELKSGKAFISNYYGTTDTVKIKDVFLGYYVGEENQDFLMPIFVFENKDNFYAFVSAIKDDCLMTNNATLDQCRGVKEKK
jgi:hypothetical protein